MKVLLLSLPLIATLMSPPAAATQHVELSEDTTIYQLAQQFATTTRRIQQLNHLNDRHEHFKSHQTLTLPADDILMKPANESLSDFLSQQKLSLNAIQQFNPFLNLSDDQQYIAVSNKGMAHLTPPSLSQLIPMSQTFSQSPPTMEMPFEPSLQHTDVSSQDMSFNNGYTPGQCTAYAFEQRQLRQRPIPNNWVDAKYWAMHAQQAGYTVSHQPRVNAILVSQEGAYGHVAIVEACYRNGIRVSEMNWQGEGIVSTRFINNPTAYQYIY
ncbi:CHAP domain-containing protein [Staphylococcus microti]|uniref:CHAP domain-containing protein n=1 Tax=Staphylococcus microti TaxID=569857 RepID=UPI000A0491F0|nr:CHAP domain-containing protein [Staphylococcus microti]PNZ84273.1 CHAP domain-containing protein [Staphylococcus microti]